MVFASIDFYDESFFKTSKINDEQPDPLLSAEFVAHELSQTETGP